MKKLLITAGFMFAITLAAQAQYKKDGTPDMRFKENKERYGNPYSTPSYDQPSQRNYDNGGQYRIQNGYQRSNGTYVNPHLKTTPDNHLWNNKNPY
jgi:hypothetical protein